MRNTNCDASSATMLEVAENDHLVATVVASGDLGAGTAPSTNPVEEFGHFVNATLLQETRSFIIAH